MDQRYLAFASQTGNCMKTMLAVAVAVEMAKEAPCLLIDADGEHHKLGWSADTWAKRRAKRQPLRQQFISYSAPTPADADRYVMQHPEAETVIADCPSRAGVAILQLTRKMDLTIIPVPANEKDCVLSCNTIETIEKPYPDLKIYDRLDMRRVGIVLTRVHTKAEELYFTDYLQRHCKFFDKITLHPPIYEQTAYANAFSRGLTIAETSPVRLGSQARATVHSITDQLFRLTPLDMTAQDAVA